MRAGFEFGKGTTKNRTYVEVPEKLVIKPFCSPDRLDPNRGDHYELQGVVIHHGRGSDSGHYTCYVNRGQTWWHCNDLDVEPLKCSVEEALKGLPQGLSQPYMLFYTAIETVFESPRRSESHFTTATESNSGSKRSSLSEPSPGLKRTRMR